MIFMKYKTRFLAFFGAMTLFNLASNYAHPVTPTIIQNLGLHDYMFGLALATMMTANFLFSPFWGKINLYISSRRSLCICCVGYGLAQLGFAATNVVFGVGAFCFHALFSPDNKFTVLTRDTWGMAMKATCGTFGGWTVPIFKDPKTDNGLKKSQKGCCIVAMDGESYTDEHGFNETLNPDVENLLKVVFVNGQVVKRQSLAEIRERLWG
mgnify:CR=1 FL=1